MKNIRSVHIAEGLDMKAAVVGVGNMGRHHARVYAQMPDVTLVAVVDPDLRARRSVAGPLGARAYASLEAMFMTEQPDIVSIAAPTSRHYILTMTALLHHCHVLVEKPIASTVAQAETMIALAKAEEGQVLAVGHIERCNPIVREIGRRMESIGRRYWIDTRRSGPPPLREPTEGVLLDLAVHDVDIMNYLLGGADPMGYTVFAVQGVGSQFEDMASVTIEFSTGVLGTLEVDRLSATKQRLLQPP